MYAFLKQLQRDKAPVSRISSVLEALNFTWHVVGVCELESPCKSRRCKGLGVTECFAEAKQAAALTVKQLCILHDTLEGHADPWTRLFAGAALTCAYARCRWSDVQHSETIIWDLNDDLDLAYIELRIGMHKTCRLQSKRHRFLHAVAPALGLRPYGKIWKECREQLGVADSGCCPFMPAPDAQGRVTIRALDSDEATAWLRMLLSSGDGADKVSSKSLKATLISWAAKRGVEPLTLQRLGYHASGGMDIVYSRDSQAPLVLLVEKLIDEVTRGMYKPDDTRSGRIVSAGAQPLRTTESSLDAQTLKPSRELPGQSVDEQETCKEEPAPGGGRVAREVLQVDSDSDAPSSDGESSESSDEDGAQPIALVAQGLQVSSRV